MSPMISSASQDSAVGAVAKQAQDTGSDRLDVAVQINRLCSMAANLLGVPLVIFVRTADILGTQDRQYPGACQENSELSNALHRLCSPVRLMSAADIANLAIQPSVPAVMSAGQDASMKIHAGVALTNAAGQIVGCLCAVALSPRLWSERDFDILAAVRGLALLALEFHESELVRQQNARALHIAEVVHDLRQPLSLIAISGELLGLAGPQKITAHCEMLRNTVGKMKILIDGLMDGVPRLTASAIRLPVNMASLIEGMARDLGPAAAQRGLTIESKLSETLPHIACNPAQIQRVFSNLLGNAIKFATPSTVIRITSQLNDGSVDFSVINEGEGIAEADVQHVFEHCWQSTLHGDGRGLGLAIVEKIVKEQGGYIAARSLAGMTTFCLTLPVLSMISPMQELELHAV